MFRRIIKSAIPGILFFSGLGESSAGPQQQRAKPETTVRVNVGLVQTDVMVFDGQGRFVPDLKPEQFELQVDGKRQPVSFCEMVDSGTERDAALWSAGAAEPGAPVRAEAPGSDAGRNVLFFVDDWHMSGESILRLRAALLNLIEETIGVNDKAAIFSAAGGVGFLQQLSDNKGVLRAAVERLTFFNQPVEDKEPPVMKEWQALAIEQNNQEVIDYFVDEMLRGGRGRVLFSRATAERIIRKRASALAAQSVEIGQRTLNSLARLLRVYAVLPGRKMIFFLSDGFVLQTQRAEILNRIHEVTDTAARAGIVIYSLDTRGLIVGGPDAANPVRPDLSGRLARNQASEVTSAQDALNALAMDTGGRFLHDTNALDAAMARTLEDISRYYLLGWYLDKNMLEPGSYRSIRVSVKGRSDLKVRVRQGKVDLTRLLAQGTGGAVMAVPAAAEPGEALVQLIRSPFPVGVLPVSMYVGHDLIADKGYCLTIAVQTPVETASGAGKKSVGEDRIDLAGLIVNLKGETVASFSDSLSIPDLPEGLAQAPDREWIYSGVVRITPGIYQVRAAVRDARTGRAGSAIQWVEAPDLSATGFTPASIFMSEAAGQAADPVPNMADGAAISVGRCFAGTSGVSYFLHVYNIGRAALQVKSRVYRGNRLVHESPFEPLEPRGSEDITRMFVRGTLPLQGLSPGSYTLEIDVKDASSNPPAVRRLPFWVQ